MNKLLIALAFCATLAHAQSLPSGNAIRLRGRAVAPTAPTDTQTLCWNTAGATWKPCAAAGGATVAAGTTTTGAPGTNASVTNTGTTTAAVFAFTIPRGDVGATGATGAAGATGTPGATGAAGATGITTGSLEIQLAGISTGLQGCAVIPFDSTITGPWYISKTSGVGSLVVDIWDTPFTTGAYPGSGAGISIVASAPPTLTSARNSTGATTGWNATIAAGRLVCASVTSVTALTYATVSVTMTHLGGGGGGGSIPLTTSTLRGNGAGGAAAVTGAGGDCVHVDGGSSACGSGGGASSVTQLTDCQVTRPTTTTLAIAPCNVISTTSGVSYLIGAGTAGISAGTGTVRLGIDWSVTPPVGKIYFTSGITATCTGSWGCTTPVAGAAFGNDDTQLYTWTTTAGTFDLAGAADLRGILSKGRVLAGSGMLSSFSGHTQTIGINPAFFPLFTLVPGTGTALASGGTITPVNRQHHVTGASAIATITAAGMIDGEMLVLIPDAAFTTTTAGNVGKASTGVIGQAMRLYWDATAAKWYPSY